MGAGGSERGEQRSFFPEDSGHACNVHARQRFLGKICELDHRDKIVRHCFPGDVIDANASGKTEFPTQIG
jgi:hypothetical protein